MSRVEGVVENGRVEVAAPADWPDGTHVVVEPAAPMQDLNSSDEAWKTDPESIEKWIAAFESIPPLEMSAEEETNWQQARQEQKTLDLAGWERRGSLVENTNS